MRNKRKGKNEKRKTKIKNLKFLILLLTFAFLILRYAHASAFTFSGPLSSSELINNARQYDGKVIEYEGEVIGDIMKRGEYAWINVNDGGSAIGVWVSAPLLTDVTIAGSYRAIGDKVRVAGVFHLACPEHGGDLDIHARSLRKVAAGRPVIEKFNLSKRNMVIALFIILFIVWTLSLLKRK